MKPRCFHSLQLKDHLWLSHSIIHAHIKSNHHDGFKCQSCIIGLHMDSNKSLKAWRKWCQLCNLLALPWRRNTHTHTPVRERGRSWGSVSGWGQRRWCRRAAAGWWAAGSWAGRSAWLPAAAPSHLPSCTWHTHTQLTDRNYFCHCGRVFMGIILHSDRKLKK